MTRREKDLSRERIERIMQLTAQGIGVTEICERLGIKRPRLYQIRSRARQREKMIRSFDLAADIRQADKEPSEASFDNVEDMLAWLDKEPDNLRRDCPWKCPGPENCLCIRLKPF